MSYLHPSKGKKKFNTPNFKPNSIKTRIFFQLAELFAFAWTLGEFLCKFVNYMQNVSAVSSVLNLTVMSIERYVM